MLCQFIGHGTEHTVSKKQRIYTIENKKNVEHELNLGFGRGASVLPTGIIFNKKTDKLKTWNMSWTFHEIGCDRLGGVLPTEERGRGTRWAKGGQECS